MLTGNQHYSETDPKVGLLQKLFYVKLERDMQTTKQGLLWIIGEKNNDVMVEKSEHVMLQLIFEKIQLLPKHGHLFT